MQPKILSLISCISSKQENKTISSMQSSTDKKTNHRRRVTELDVTRTPNVPRIRASFFNRKYRDISNCPPTPATPKPSRNTPSRVSGRQCNYDPYSPKSTGRSSRSKANQNELIGSDFSTPKTTRTLLTPTTTGRNNSTRGSRVPHLIYPPLELDNESSSESSDTIMRRRNNKRPNSQDFPLILAIEAVPNDMTAKSRLPDKVNCEPELQVIVIDDDDTNDQTEVKTLERKKLKIERKEPQSHDSPKADSRLDKIATEIDEVSQCITPPITPEKAQDADLVPKLPAFIPGNCNIDEILKLYGSATNKSSDNISSETDSKAN